MPLPKCEGDDKGLQALFVFLHWFLSFSPLSRSVHRLSLSSLPSSTPQHSQSVHATYETLNSLSTVFYRSHSPYTRRTKPWQTWVAFQLHFIILTVPTCDVRNNDRLLPVWGSLKLASITNIITNTDTDIILVGIILSLIIDVPLLVPRSLIPIPLLCISNHGHWNTENQRQTGLKRNRKL